MDDNFSFGGGLGTGGLYDEADMRGSDPTGAGGLYDVREVAAPVSDVQPSTTMKPTQPQDGLFGAIGDIVGGVMTGGQGGPTMGAPQGGSGGGGMFGSDLILPGIFGRPSYKATDANASPAEQAADMLQQRMQRASAVATNPFVQLFNPGEAQRAQQFLMQAPKALQEAKTQQATVSANLYQMQQLGLGPGEGGLNEYSTTEQRVQVAQQRAMKGDLNAFKGLQVVDPKSAEAIQDKVYETVSGHIGKATEAFGILSNMTTPREYDEAVKMLRNNGTLGELEAVGIKAPSYDQFQQQKGIMGRTLRETQQGLNKIGTNLKERNSFVPMEEKEAKTYTGTFRTAYGDTIDAGPMTRNQTSGLRGMTIQGMDDPRNLGKTFVLATPEQRKALREEFDVALPKNQYEKYRESQRLYGMATSDDKGNPLPAGKINTNPNIQQGIAEGLAAALRGGNGGANGQLLNIEAGKRGWTQTMLDKMKGGWAGLANVIDGPDGKKEYLTEATQKQMREVIDYLHNYDKQHVAEAVGGVVERAGALGLDASVFGLSKKEAGAVAELLEVGRQNQIGRMLPYHRAIGSGNGVLMVDPQTAGSPSPVGAPAPVQPGGTAPALPQPVAGGGTPVSGLPARGGPEPSAPAPGAVQAGPVRGSDPRYGDASTPIPGERNIAPSAPTGAPLAPAAQPNLSAVPAVGMAARAQAPAAPTQRNNVTLAPGSAVANVAGQNVNVRVPAGASTDYVNRMAGIESSAERNPWRATTPRSTASGAFQFLDRTWAANKPPGAPARAKDATPQQQVQALENFTAKNAAALGVRGVPVNDTTLYMAHNLGAAGATKLLKADPNADATKVVGADVARNNPKFFSGGATVAQAVERYHAAMGAGGGGVRMPAALSGAPPNAAMSPEDQAAASQARFEQAARDRYAAQRERMSKAMEGTGGRLAEAAPAALGTAGAVGGAVLGGPVGGVAGGAAGGALGDIVKNWVQGKSQDPKEIAKEAALSGVLGVVPAARPIASAAARVAGVAGIEGADAAMQGKRPSEIAESAAIGGASALAGEAFGRALGMAGHKLFSNFTPSAQVTAEKTARELGEARAVMSKTEPKLQTGGPNPAYQAAETKAKAAETKLKDFGLDPDGAVYAAKAAEEGVPRAEAVASRPMETERAKIGQEYQQLRSEVADKGVGAPRATAKLPDGPIAQVEKGAVSKKHLEEAQRTEMAITAPAQSWPQKWDQLADERSRLLTLERDALASTSTGKSREADDMRRLADSVRKQQEKVADYVFGPQKGPEVIGRLKALDVRYRRVMEAADGDLLKAAGMRGEKGRAADRAFRAFAAGDPEAIRAWTQLQRESRSDGLNDAMHAVGRLPVVGHTVSAVQVAKKLFDWMRGRSAGAQVRFKELAQPQMPAGAIDFGGQIGAGATRGMTMQ